MEVINAGNRAISKADVERPIIISVGGAKLVRAQVMKSTPESLEPIIELLDRGVLIRPLLLNPGDKVQLGMLTSGRDISLSVAARISEVKDIKLVDPIDSKEARKYWISAISALLLLPIYGSFMLQGFGRWVYAFRGLRIRSSMMIPMGIVCVVSSASLGSQMILPYRDELLGMVALGVIGLVALVFSRLVLTKRVPWVD